METAKGYDPGLWQRLAEMGVLGIATSEAYGGIGGDALLIEALMEEVGAALVCGPLLSSTIFAATLIESLGDLDVSASLLPQMAAGSLIATVAVQGAAGTGTQAGDAPKARRDASGWRLDGEVAYVIHADAAHIVLVAAETPEGVGVFLAEGDARGLTRSSLSTFDKTLRLSRLRFDATPARRIEARRECADALADALELVRVALAGEQAGGARRVLEITVDYAKSRIQFGRSIGSFQAIKHMAADLLLEVESATSAAREAARCLSMGSASARPAVSLAASACGDAFVKVSADAIQMHGGIAFTWDHDAHLYLRRARADAQLFGTPAFHRERYLRAVGA
jgi:alkylation response protein AidB-like acyl-CoA dehydrogenase